MELTPQEQSEQDRRMMIAMGLAAVVVFVFYTFVFTPPPPPPGDSTTATPTETVGAPGAAATPSPGSGAGASEPVPGAASALEGSVEASPAVPVLPVRELERGWSGVGASWSSRGGSPTSVELDDYVVQGKDVPWLPTWLLGAVTGRDQAGFALTCADGKHDERVDVVRDSGVVTLPVGTDPAGIVADTATYEVVEETSDRLVFRTLRDGIEIQKAYGLPREGHVIDYTVTMTNRSGASRELRPSFGVADFMPESEGQYGPSVEAQAYVDDDHEVADQEKLLKRQGEPLTFTGPIEWLAIGDKYFLLGLEPAAPLDGTATLRTLDPEKGRFASVLTLPARPLAAGESASWQFRVWAGPKSLDGLQGAKLRLASSVDFGMFGLVAIPILYFLQFLFGVFGNWGVAIIVLTIVVKLILFPLTQKQYRSMKQMQLLNPEIQALKERLKDDREAINKETMKLFSDRGVNPMGGCLPMLVQMPIWFALYRVLWMSADLYQVDFLYLCDLTLQDPIGVMPTIMGVTMYVTTKMNQSPTMDPAQQRIMTLMPVIFSVIMFTMPAGLVLYIFVNNILSILQQWLINRGDKASTAGSKA